ncbi:MAG: hypothetical protein K9M98_08550 [Cephaloticoccus sp.]|nr:hypothetical protein [Cephaloticoccus sp.]MCF7760539.1 hypothetical protein [Cephaloticoccus sp.]
MEYLIGLSLALAVSLFARVTGLDRDRAFYPTVMIVIAALYGLFAIMGGHPGELTLEWIMMVGFIVLATLGFRFNLWLVVLALFAHGVMDIFHGHLITNPGVPVWWPGFCSTYDIAAAAWLAWLLWRRPETVRMT